MERVPLSRCPRRHTFGGELSALCYTACDRSVFAVNANTAAPGSDAFFPHNAGPGVLRVEGRIPQPVRDELASRGHAVEVEDDWVAGDVLAIVVDTERGCVRGGVDPRGEVSRRMPSYGIAW